MGGIDQTIQEQLGRARHYLQIGNAKRALAELEQGGTALVEEGDFWSIRAEALFDLKRWKEAAEAARRGLADSPDDVTLLDILALCELQLDHRKEAEERIRAALEIWPDHPTLLAHHALILARAKRFKDAERVLAEALRVAPQSPDVVLARTQVARLRGKRAEAAAYADELLALEPDDEVSHLARGTVDLASARFKGALRHYEEAARLNPEDPAVAEALREARIGSHPLLAPVRPIWRFGRLRSWLVYFTIISALAAAHLYSVRYVIGGIWVTACVLSWVAPPILRRWYRRKRRAF